VLENLTALKLPSNFEIALEASILKDSFHDFVRESFHVVEPEIPFIDNWHIRAICTYLEACYDGRIRNLIINIPPGHMKSLLVNVFFPAWVWTKDQSKQFIFTSYGEDLVARDSAKCKSLIESQWYQDRFHVETSKSPDTATKFATTRGGHRLSFGFGGAVTGHHGDFICIDDPLKAAEAESKAVRNKVNDDFDNAVSNRLRDPQTGCRIVIMQRLHQDDLVGHILEKNLNYEMLILPAEYEGVRFHSSIGFVDPRTEAGELLWEQRFGRSEIDELKNTLSERGIAGQLQQRPAPLLGNIFKREWFKNRSNGLGCIARYISWDTAASVQDSAAYSCGVVGELSPDYRLFIREVFRERLEFPQLQYRVEEQANRHKDRRDLRGIIIENKSSGTQVIQSLKQTSNLTDYIIPYNPKGDKTVRHYNAAKWCEKGMIILPEPSDEFPWLPDFEDEIFSTPNTKFLDQSDAFSQLVDYLSHYLEEGLQARTRR
jgi:predicted phage terminase large subunit-like protein